MDSGPQRAPDHFRSGIRSGNLCRNQNNHVQQAAMQEEEKLPLPEGVREKHGSWHWVVKHKWTKLCRVSEGRARLFERLFEEAGGTPGSAWHAILSYMRDGMGALAESTRTHYRNDCIRLLHHFGHYQLDQLEPTHIAQFLKWCRENDRATTGNREKAVLSSVFEFALAEGWCSYNPCRGVRRNKERPSRAYVEHDTLKTDLDRAPPELYALLGTAYLTGIRQTDLRLVTVDQDMGSTLQLQESKTGKWNEHEVTPTIRMLLTKAAEHKESVAARHEKRGRFDRAAQIRAIPQIFVSKRGLPWTENGLQSALRRFDLSGYTFRQLRPKAQTDRPDKNVIGHTGQMREAYTRRRRLSAVK
jgi:site-specific recombinase XerD